MFHIDPTPTATRRPASLLATAMTGLLLAVTPGFAAAATKTSTSGVRSNTILPETAVGRLGNALIQHVNQADAVRIREWARTVLSTDIPAADREAFVELLAASTRDSGGLEVVDVRGDPRQPGMLQIAVKARRNARRGLFVLNVDAVHPDRFVQADLVAMDDPAIYAHWPKETPARAELPQLIRNTMDQLVRFNDFSGCVTVSDGEKPIFDECRGPAERRFNVPVDGRTKFHIGSINKMFTAVAIAQLVEAGKLSWNDTLATRVPEYPDQAAARNITVWQLLHHTSGLGDFLVPEFFEHREKFVDPVDYLGLIARQPKSGEPGGPWNYSNAGYMLLGRIIENVSGENYFDYMQRHVFAPAGMRDSGFDRLDDVVPQLAVGYYKEGPFSDAWKVDWFKNPYRAGPAGGGYSTNTDLLRFSAALHAGKLLRSATLGKIFEDEVPAGAGGYAAGFGDRLSHGRHVRGHAGGIEGTDANLQIVWETGATVALTSNQGPGQSWFFAERIADVLAAAGANP